MKYEGMIFRPPSEAESLILQVTVGCSYNRCTFCGAYRGKKFRVKRFEEIQEDIDEVSGYPIRRVFLADGDALAIPQDELRKILEYLRRRIKGLERVGIYANARDILRKGLEQLKELRTLGLGILYLGLESGDPHVLKRVKKNATVEQMIQAARIVKEAGILLSVTVILGLGGVEGSQAHARETGLVLSKMDPDFVGALSLMVVPGTPIEREIEEGRLVLPTPFGLIQELETMIEHSEMTHCFFASNHASNYLPLRFWIPEQKEEALRRIREVLKRRDPALLRPEYLRGL
ncbi:MAG: radical SAM protein [Desulfobacterota bacterium]|nr:radical SAM protein [Thermodesulfobacteriota bacterium]